jgi:hypothetical protein
MRSWKILGYDLPDADRIDAMVGVSNNIAQSSHFAPRKTPIPTLDIFGTVGGRLTNNLQCPLNCVSELAIPPEIVYIMSLGKTPGIGHRLVNIGEILFLTTGHETERQSGR